MPDFASRLVLALVLILGGCTSRFDWREARTPAGELRMLLPGRPATLTRRIHLRDEAVDMTMIGADADGLAFTVAVVGNGGAGDPDRARQRLADMRDQMLRNIGAGPARVTAPREAVAGRADASVGKPSPVASLAQPGRIAVVDPQGTARGQREAEAIEAQGSGSQDGVRMSARFFLVRGRPAQAVVVGRGFDEAAAAQFFDSLRIVEP